MNKYLSKYSYKPDLEAMDATLDRIAENIAGECPREILMDCFSFMDLTTLHSSDTGSSVKRLVDKVNSLPAEYPDYPMPASICVFSNFASVVASERRDTGVHVTTVAGCFPAAQSFLEVKVRECEMTVQSGAEEVDIVLPLNSFLAEDYESAASEIRAMRAAVDSAGQMVGRKVILKVILETGLLVSPELIATASFLAMEEGADFIKTSTGKVDVNATPAAAYIMCDCIRRFCEVTGRRVGFKAAGGISTAKDAASYYAIVASVLGNRWLCRDLFRLGVSRLGNSLMSAIERKTVTFF